jgi:hypothetical protein
VTEVLEPNESSTRPKRSPKPNLKYSSDDYDLLSIINEVKKFLEVSQDLMDVPERFWPIFLENNILFESNPVHKIEKWVP